MLLKKMLVFTTSLIYGLATTNVVLRYVDNKIVQFIIEVVLLVLFFASAIIIDKERENEND